MASKTSKLNLTKTKKTIIGIATSVVLVFVITMSIILTTCSKKEEKPFQIKPLELPIADNFALKKYDFEDLDQAVVAVRQDAMDINDEEGRNIARIVPDILTNEYALVYDKQEKTLTAQYGFSKTDEYGREFNKYDLTAGNYRISNSQIEAVKIDFKKYPRTLAVNGVSNHGIGGGDIGDNTVAINEIKATIDNTFTNADYLNFYKYMLFSQCYNLTTEAATRSYATRDNAQKMEEYKRWLKKHPAADAIYGRVLGSDGLPVTLEEGKANNKNAVVKKITVDPIYRSLHATGLYLPAGEPVKLKIEGLKAGEQIGLKMNEQDSCAWVAGVGGNYLGVAGVSNLNQVKFASGNNDGYFQKGDMAVATGFSKNVSTHNHWSKAYGRLPWIRSMVNYSADGEYVYGSPLGGVIEIDMKNCYSKVTITIEGAVETPHFILGTTTPEYYGKYLRQAPGVVAILDTENGQLIGPTMEMGTSLYMRRVTQEEVEKLAMLWHSFLSVNESFTGGKYNRFNKVMFDWLVPAGAAVSMGNYSFAQPTGWFDGCMNYRGLLSYGNWGTLHEIGHNHANSYGTFWGFGDGREGEVHNNALTILAYIMFCDAGTTIRHGGTVEHGTYTNPYNTLTETLNHPTNTKNLGCTDYGDGKYYEYFKMLGMYANIMHSFGAEKFYELLKTYSVKGNYSSKSDAIAKRADFAYRCAITYGMNFFKYFNTFYLANIPEKYDPTKVTKNADGTVADDANLLTEEQYNYINSLPNYQVVANYYAGGIDGVKTAGDYKVTFGSDITFNLYNYTISTLDTKDADGKWVKGFDIIGVDKPEHGSITDIGDGKWVYSFDKSYNGTFDNFTFRVKLKDGIIHRLTVTLRISYNGAQLTSYNDIVQPENIKTFNWDTALSTISQKSPDAVTGISSAGVPGYNTAAGKRDARVLEFYWKPTKTEEVSLSATADDWVKLYFDNEEILTLTYTNAHKDYATAKKSVTAGNFYYIKLVNINTGGGGSAGIGIKYKDATSYTSIPDGEIFHPSYPTGMAPTKTFVYEPQFLISKKDNISLSTTGSDKTKWEIVKAPENVHQGRFTEETKYAMDNDGNPIDTGEKITIDKWSYLIDGLTGTNLHTTYGGGVPQITENNPHIFILDTKKVQQFNYYTVITRNQGNSYIVNYKLQILDTKSGNDYENGQWNTIVESGKGNNTATLNIPFEEVTGRYFKLIVTKTTGGNFSVLAEIDAGIKSATERIVSFTSDKLFTTSGWQNTSQIAEIQNGYIMANKKDEKVVIKFKGDSIALYSAVGKNYGTANVYIDGEFVQEIDTNSDIDESRKLVLAKSNLENKEHTVEVITTSSNRVMLNIIGMSYISSLINASNIYFERALINALIVFIVLFVAVTTILVVAIFVPGFRNFIFGNKLIQKLDERSSKPKAEKVVNKTENTARPTASIATPTAKPTTTLSKPTTPTSTAKPTVTKPTTPTKPITPTKPTPQKDTKQPPKPPIKPTTKK